MCKTLDLTFLSLELVNELFELAYHFIVVACIIASDTQDLISCE